jgi:hypothetical protein
MPSDMPPEPWRSFLADIDAEAKHELAVHCIGGFAVSLYYGLTRPTADLDLVEVAPATAVWPERTAGRGSALHRKHKLYVQIVTVATLPDSYPDPPVPLRVAQMKRSLDFDDESTILAEQVHFHSAAAVKGNRQFYIELETRPCRAERLEPSIEKGLIGAPRPVGTIGVLGNGLCGTEEQAG